MTSKKSAFSLFQLSLLIFGGEMIFVLPFVVTRIFRPTFLEVFGITNFELGKAFSLYGAVAMVSYFLGGPIADRFSARFLMSFALLLTGVGGFLLAAIPDPHTLTLLYGYWGLTSILLFWAALIKATRIIGGSDQGRAFGLLDGGRGLLAALMGTVFVGLFALLLPSASQESIGLGAKTAALQTIIISFSFLVMATGVVVGIFLRVNIKPEPVGSLAPNEPALSLSHKMMQVAARPSVWFQSIIILCAYVGYKCTDDFSLYAKDVLDVSDVHAAGLGTVSFWVRPFAAIAAGVIADRVRVSNMLYVGFLFALAGSFVLSQPGFAGGGLVYLGVVVALCSVGIYGLRGLYFAVFEEAKIPVSITGCAIGIVSVLGYTPDIFMGPWMGWILDNNPGALGHQKLFALLSYFCIGGLVATFGFQFCTGSIQGPTPPGPVRKPPELEVVK